MLKIISNGSKWLGKNPDSIETLLNILDNYTLDPTFENYGNFITEYKPMNQNSEYSHLTGYMSIFGNFMTLSHVFNIITDEKEIIDKLTAAIRKNQQSEQYQEYRKENVSKLIITASNP